MNRRDFIKNGLFASLGLSMAPTLLQSCRKKDELLVNFNGKVLIIGAGSAGLMAGYTLQQYGIDFEIIEASSVFGGRVKKSNNLADFPIDLGAEWIHDEPSVLGQLINDDSVDAKIDLLSYQPESYSVSSNNDLSKLNVGMQFYREYKFRNSTWFDFFEDYIVPSIADKIVYNQPVSKVNYLNDQVVVESEDGSIFTGDKVILTVPISILKAENIVFQPVLPVDFTESLGKVSMPPGLKVFIKFSKKFYPDLMYVPTENAGENDLKLYYNAAFKKDTEDHVLGMIQVGPDAERITSLEPYQITDLLLLELDKIFYGQASEYYISSRTQNWSNEPYIQGSYSFETFESEYIEEGVNGRLYFAGEAYHPWASSTVQGAGYSGRDRALKIIQGG